MVPVNVLAFLLVGLMSGWIANLIEKKKGRQSLINFTCGTVGAFAGGYMFDIRDMNSFGIWGALGMSVIGAYSFLFILNVILESLESEKALK